MLTEDVVPKFKSQVESLSFVLNASNIKKYNTYNFLLRMLAKLVQLSESLTNVSDARSIIKLFTNELK